MKLLRFETAVVARTVDDELLVALMSNGTGDAMSHECVALLSCAVETGIGLGLKLSSAAKETTPQ